MIRWVFILLFIWMNLTGNLMTNLPPSPPRNKLWICNFERYLYSINFTEYSSFYMKKNRKMNEILFDKNKCSGSSKAKFCMIVSKIRFIYFHVFPGSWSVWMWILSRKMHHSLRLRAKISHKSEIIIWEVDHLFPWC